MTTPSSTGAQCTATGHSLGAARLTPDVTPTDRNIKGFMIQACSRVCMSPRWSVLTCTSLDRAATRRARARCVAHVCQARGLLGLTCAVACTTGRHKRVGPQVCRRAPGRPEALNPWRRVHGQQRPEHQRQPVLHHVCQAHTPERCGWSLRKSPANRCLTLRAHKTQASTPSSAESSTASKCSTPWRRCAHTWGAARAMQGVVAVAPPPVAPA